MRSSNIIAEGVSIMLLPHLPGDQSEQAVEPLPLWHRELPAEIRSPLGDGHDSLWSDILQAKSTQKIEIPIKSDWRRSSGTKGGRSFSHLGRTACRWHPLEGHDGNGVQPSAICPRRPTKGTTSL